MFWEECFVGVGFKTGELTFKNKEKTKHATTLQTTNHCNLKLTDSRVYVKDVPKLPSDIHGLCKTVNEICCICFATRLPFSPYFRREPSHVCRPQRTFMFIRSCVSLSPPSFHKILTGVPHPLGVRLQLGPLLAWPLHYYPGVPRGARAWPFIGRGEGQGTSLCEQLCPVLDPQSQLPLGLWTSLFLHTFTHAAHISAVGALTWLQD